MFSRRIEGNSSIAVIIINRNIKGKKKMFLLYNINILIYDYLNSNVIFRRDIVNFNLPKYLRLYVLLYEKFKENYNLNLFMYYFFKFQVFPLPLDICL